MTVQLHDENDGGLSVIQKHPFEYPNDSSQPTTAIPEAIDMAIINSREHLLDVEIEMDGKIITNVSKERTNDDAIGKNGAQFGADSNDDDDSDSDDDMDYVGHGSCSKKIEVVEKAAQALAAKYNREIRGLFKATLYLLYFSYYGYCMSYRFGDEGSTVLTVITAFLVLRLFLQYLEYKGVTQKLTKKFLQSNAIKKSTKIRVLIRRLLYLVALVGIFSYLGADLWRKSPRNAQPLFGIAVLIFVCFIFSRKPSRVNWHPVFWGFVIQILLALLILRNEYGRKCFQWVGNFVERFLKFSEEGSRFVISENFKDMGLAFAAGGIGIFFNGVIFVLIHWGVIEIVVQKGGRFLSLCLDTGPVESVVAVANIFLGLSESPLMILPYLPTLSMSELCAVLTCGFASVSGGGMGLFIAFGAPANHLLTASILSAPAALAVAKLVAPETKKVDILSQKNISIRGDTKEKSALSAFADGAGMALKILGASMANMLAFYSLLAMLNSLVEWIGLRAGVEGLSFELICGYLLFPLAWSVGIAASDCMRVAVLIGIKLFATPMWAYVQLGKMIKSRAIFEDYVMSSNGTWRESGLDIILEATNTTLEYGVMSERSEVICTYLICGYSALTAIGICIGTVGTLCPQRKPDIIKLVTRAFFAGNFASFATGAVVGLVYTEEH